MEASKERIMGKPTNAQLTEKLNDALAKNTKLVELADAQEQKIAVLEEDLHSIKKVNQELLSKETDTVTSADVEGFDALAVMFTDENAFNLDTKKYDLERLFYVFQKDRKAILVVRAIKTCPVKELTHVQGSVLYNRYVDHAKKLQEVSTKELFGIQLSFEKY